MSASAQPAKSDWYQTNALFETDALVLMERIPSGVADLVFIDPSWNPGQEPPRATGEPEAMGKHLRYLARVLQQARRVLTDRGNLFLYSTAELNGNFRLVLDQVFGRTSFRAEIIVPRLDLHRVGRVPGYHDTLFHYSKTESFLLRPQFRAAAEGELRRLFTRTDEKGPYRLADLTTAISRESRRFSWHGITPPRGRSWRYSSQQMDELMTAGRIEIPAPTDRPQALLKQYQADSPGIEVGTIWDDISPIVPRGEWRYSTQKSEELQARVIAMSTEEGSIVVDPFCGSGTTLVAAERNKRHWIGGDISPQAIEITRERLRQQFGLSCDPPPYLFADQTYLATHLPAVFTGYTQVATGFEDLTKYVPPKFVLGEAVAIEETREYEFKEVKGNNPLNSIANTADEYAVAFLNSEGGRIFWGVRDSDRVVVGVKLSSVERDGLRITVSNKLSSILPQIDPTQYRLEIHHVEAADGTSDLAVVELIVPKVRSSDPYFTGSNEMFVRIDGMKKKLTGPQLTDWIKRRIMQ